MYLEVASKLALGNDAMQYSQAVSMEGANSVQIEATAFTVTGTLSIYLEGSNDLENWEVIGTSMSLAAATRYSTKKFSGPDNVAYRYVRLKYDMSNGGSDFAIVAAGINTANL